jgi:putative Mg2+ transporter-C (MgtC) family protein
MISNWEITARLALAALLGSAIGFERERLLWAAGIRTHMLVSVGSCLLMIVSAYGFQTATTMPHVVLDPSRIAAQVVSGIGFLGAGSILLRNQVVKGLTTAASVWTVAAIGLAAGGGLTFAALLATAIILAILVGVKPLEQAYRARVQSCVLEVVGEGELLSAPDLRALTGLRGGQIRRVTVTPHEEEGLVRARLHLFRLSKRDIRVTARRLEEMPGIQSVETISKPGRSRD